MFRRKTEQSKSVRGLAGAHQSGADERGPIDHTVTELRGMSKTPIFAGETAKQRDRREVEQQRAGADHGRVRRGHGAQNVSDKYNTRHPGKTRVSIRRKVSGTISSTPSYKWRVAPSVRDRRTTATTATTATTTTTTTTTTPQPTRKTGNVTL